MVFEAENPEVNNFQLKVQKPPVCAKHFYKQEILLYCIL